MGKNVNLFLQTSTYQEEQGIVTKLLATFDLKQEHHKTLSSAGEAAHVLFV